MNRLTVCVIWGYAKLRRSYILNLFWKKNQYNLDTIGKKSMPLLSIVVLAFVQGVTEFLPISSSGHLLLLHRVLDTQGGDHFALLLDIAVHVGTLLAVCVYFWRDLWQMVWGLIALARGDLAHCGARFGLRVCVSSIPVIVAGFALYAWDPVWLRQTWIVAVTTILFAVLLLWADEYGVRARQERRAEDMGMGDALWIGFAQICALIPGTSRSGVTMTVGRFLGFSRIESARYSLLLGTVAISGAGVLAAFGAFGADEGLSGQGWGVLAVAALLACLVALVAIAVMMRWLARQSFRVFVVYRLLLGAALCVALWQGWII